MTTNEQVKKSSTRRLQERQQRDAAISLHVLEALGGPADLHRVDVKLLWECHYRVNVLIGTEAMNARVRHSYFVVTDGEGKVVAAMPGITKLY